jgi:peptidoglycan/LPS O-acetylase OafA/YrhL
VTETATTLTAPSTRTSPAPPALPGASAAAAQQRSGAWSAEVQALRAVAVLLVLAFHLWPSAVTGGYVGVDVFFVISGFLITGHIVRDLDAGRFGLGRFYVRRARRLLPAAMVVLLAVTLTIVLLTPHTRWMSSMQQILASAGYVQNWVLANADVDYLSPNSTPTAVQHFWSLSVEEQFYFVWPVLLLAAAWLTRRRRKRVRRLAVGGVMLAVTLVSLGYGLWATATNPAGAYFFSTTRMWEFAVGGLLALALQSGVRAVGERHHVLAGLLCWSGLAAITASAFLYTERTAFPGYAAILPVAGSLAVIAAGPVRGLWSPAPLVRFRGTQFVGDVSYSLYLWHWPLIVLLPVILGERLGRLDRVGVLVLSLVFAWLSLVLVENRLRAGRGTPPTGATAEAGAATQAPRRFARLRAWRPGPAFAVITASTLAVTGIAGGAWYDVERRISHAREVADEAIATGVPCFGAAALADPSCDPPYGDLVTPDPAGTQDDMRSQEAWQRCFVSRETAGVRTCSFGPAGADYHVVLFGDSHALQWVAPLRQVAEREGWLLTTVMRASCTPNSAFMTRKLDAEANLCHDWATAAIDRIAGDPTVDAVVTSAYNNKRWKPEGGRDAYATGVQGYRDTWARFLAGGEREVVVLKDTPRPMGGTLSCVTRDPSGADCSRTRGPATQRPDDWRKLPDPMVAAVSASPRDRVHLVDLTDSFCDERRCPAVIGNVLVYADSNHMTPTFARTLVPALRDRLTAVLGPGHPPA